MSDTDSSDSEQTEEYPGIPRTALRVWIRWAKWPMRFYSRKRRTKQEGSE